MNIHQVQTSYSAQEDRIIMRINNREDEEISLFLTRRIVVLFLDILNKTIDHTLANNLSINDIQKTPITTLIPSITGDKTIPKQMENQIYRQNIINNSDYSTPFNKGEYFPMGDSPILIEKITINTSSNDNIVLIFKSTHGKNICLNLNFQILNNLSDLLIKIMPATKWNIDLINNTNVIIQERNSNTLLH